MIVPAEQDEGVEPQEGGQETPRPDAPAGPEGGSSEVESGGEPVEIDQDHQGDDVPKRVARDPGAPTQSERDEHCIDHWPYRSWCEDCVRGRATGEQHKTSERQR